MTGWSILRWECEGEDVSVWHASDCGSYTPAVASIRLNVGSNSVTLSGLSVEQLQVIENAIRKARVQLSKAQGQASRAACLTDCPPVGSIVEHVTCGRRGKIVGFDGYATRAVELQGEWCPRNWQPDTYFLVAAADADGVVNAEQA